MNTVSGGKRAALKNQLFFHAMTLPGFAFVVIFCFVPMVGIIMAFQDYAPAKGLFGSPFVGVKHFAYLFSLPESFRIFRNTLLIAFGKIVLGSLTAIVFSILLNEIRIARLKKGIQTIVYLPHFLSWVVLASVVVNMVNLDGPVNQGIAALGLGKINFLGDNRFFQPLLIVTDVWKEFGYSSVVYLAALTGIDPGLYEAASIDGAGWFRRIWHITLPGMMTIILLMAAMSLANILNAGFDQVYNLYSPLVYESGDILDTYVYRSGVIGLQYSFATAVGLLKSVIGIVLMVSANAAAGRMTGQRIF
ncbi:MAG: ABC transporter permease subunit [Treponema sp.]|jgi:putative aldouronate transport system permease protein|nr:ABC transporter permease subunit [Treponema sp.]